MLLYQVGTETQEIFEMFANTGEDQDTAKTKLDEYFSPKKNVTYEIFQFRQATQQAGESVEQFAKITQTNFQLRIPLHSLCNTCLS